MNNAGLGVLCELLDLAAEYGDRTTLNGMWRFLSQRAEFLRELGDTESAVRWDNAAKTVRLVMCELHAELYA